MSMNKIKLYISLTKPRVIELLLITSIPSLFYFNNALPSFRIIFGVLIGGFLGAGGSNAVNAVYESESDKCMARTKHRPTASGAISKKNGYIFSIILLFLSFFITLFLVNFLSAFLIMVAAFIYIFIYTIWLKPRSDQNIVIGGAAGAIPPMVACAAVTNTVTLQAWLLFLIIFFWTPPHFWALACNYYNDYKNANFPMLPITKGEDRSIKESFIYAVLTCLTCYYLVFISNGNTVSVYILTLITSGFLFTSFFYLIKKLKHMTYFHITNVFLTCFFLALILSI